MKNFKLFTLAVVTMVTMIFVSASMAQTNTTGTVEGTITDQNGAVVRGVTVTLAGPNLICSQTATSDDNGGSRFSSVPPGRSTLETAPSCGVEVLKPDTV